MTKYNLITTKGVTQTEGTLDEAIAAAREWDDQFGPTFGVTVEDDATGLTVAEVRDGKVELSDSEE